MQTQREYDFCPNEERDIRLNAIDGGNTARHFLLLQSEFYKPHLGNLFPTYLEKAESGGEYCNSFTNHRNILEKEKHENLAMKIKSVYDIIKT